MRDKLELERVMIVYLEIGKRRKMEEARKKMKNSFVQSRATHTWILKVSKFHSFLPDFELILGEN